MLNYTKRTRALFGGNADNNRTFFILSEPFKVI